MAKLSFSPINDNPEGIAVKDHYEQEWSKRVPLEYTCSELKSIRCSVPSAVTTLALVNIGVHQSNGHKQPLVEFHMPSGS